MKKVLLVCSILFILISPIFGLRHIILKNNILKESEDLQQPLNEEKIKNLEGWAVINGYAAVISFTIGFLLIIWIVVERPYNYISK